MFCSYSICRVKEATGRVVVWRQFGVTRSYTLEASYCGTTRDCWSSNFGSFSSLDSASSAGQQVCPRVLEGMGSHLCEAFLRLSPSTPLLSMDPSKAIPRLVEFAEVSGVSSSSSSSPSNSPSISSSTNNESFMSGTSGNEDTEMDSGSLETNFDRLVTFLEKNKRKL